MRPLLPTWRLCASSEAIHKLLVDSSRFSVQLLPTINYLELMAEFGVQRLRIVARRR